MEYALELKTFNKKFLDKKIDRIYFGDAFCQNLIPTKVVVLEAYKKIIDSGKKFTLNTPFLTDDNINKILKNIEVLYKYNKDFEITLNDYGLFYEVRRYFPDIQLNLGRLLTKQKTDPNIIKNVNVNNLSKSDINKLIFKSLPKNIYIHFQSSMMNDKIYQKYLIKNNVTRFEIEYLLWDMKISLPKQIKATIYYPYAHITTTRNCGISNMTYKKCSKLCNSIKIEINESSGSFPYTLIGNTVYYNIEKYITKQDLQKYSCIDRVVFNDIEKYKRFIYGVEK